MGKGKLCSLLFKKGDPKRFVVKEVNWSKILPDFMVFVFTIIGGVILLVRDFNRLVATLLGVLIILSFGGTAFMRGSFTCKHCRQREIGCPAEKLLSNKTIQNKKAFTGNLPRAPAVR